MQRKNVINGCVTIGVVFLIATLASMLVGNGGRGLRARSRPLSDVWQCKSNLKNIGAACELYATDNRGAYPPSLRLLAPSYLKTLPTCAAASSDTYSRSFRAFNRGQEHRYTFFCSGLHHADANEAANYPQYNSALGLIVTR